MSWRTPKYVIVAILIVVSLILFYKSYVLKNDVIQLQEQIMEPLEVLPKLIENPRMNTANIAFINNPDEYLRSSLENTASVVYDSIKYEGTLISGLMTLASGLGLLLIPVDEYERKLWKKFVEFMNPL
ncbi:hypothetical protein [Paenibacillus aquistagni]|uniref:Uncharacterized protein n=1 Tax=Paenibacillus aquistagni TaxID=1852522 RepID=A0A1X7LRK8_9BACL|nr:hypothetical protein [Paenibacillus aquistagni]SMG56455.1 hypothetical protein SAMN06295960_4132 [Paenibacillus aquistagni]